MLAVTALLLTGLAAAGPTAGPASPAPVAACDDASVRPIERVVGPATARTEVLAFLDPASSQSWRIWLELRRLVVDQEGEVRVRVQWASGGGMVQPQAERVRAFVASLAGAGHAGPVLAAVARDGLERMHARLVDSEAHQALAKELGVPVAAVRAALRDRCARHQVIEHSRHLREALAQDDDSMVRLPVFVVGEITFDDGPSLDRLRPELGVQGLRRRVHEDPSPPGPPPPVEATSERMRRPLLPGVLLGGPGLPHRFVLMARDEEDPTLFVVLPPVLALRRDHPGQLALHVVSRGASDGAERLRHRLCAARVLGLGPAYLDYLARDALLRKTPGPVDAALLAALDDVPATRCADEIDPVELDLPDGAWLDGLPRSRSELNTLDSTLRLLDAAARPLDLVLVSPRDEL